MERYKICVYTIAKNEEKNVDKWVDSMSEADYVCVLDTGSTDNTVQRLKDRGVIVEQKIITPWRFDVARNESMKLIPADTYLCVSTDLDEVFEPGWAEKLRQVWKVDGEYEMGRYWYIFQHSKTGGPEDAFFRDKIHINNPEKFYWQFPIHEVLHRDETIKELLIPEITLHHWQNKETKRGSYLTLMEMEYEENPENTRNLFLLGREYYIVENSDMAIKRLGEFVKIGPRKIAYERGFAQALIGYSWLRKGDIIQAKLAFDDSIKTFDKFRLPYLGMATAYMIQENYSQCKIYIFKALNVTKRFALFSDEGAAWEDKPYKLLFNCYIKENNPEKALECVEKIIKFDNDEMWQKNKTGLQQILVQKKLGQRK